MAAATQVTVLFKGVNQVTPAATAASSSLTKVGSSASTSAGMVGKLGQAGTLLKGTLVVAAVAAVKSLADMGMESERVNAQTTAALQSTGSAANVTATEVQGLAESVMSYSGISDEAVQSGENMLLTFTNIRNEVGAGNDIFNQATVALTDMATRMSGGVTPSSEALSASAIKLGKSLNDPVAGMTALSRVGVQFTAAQKESITTMVQAGDTMGAQKVILAELTKEFGGSAAAMGGTFAGQWNIIKETVGNVIESLVVGVMKLVTPLMTLAATTGTLVPVVIAVAAAWGVYTLAQNTALMATIATTAAAWLGVPAITALGLAGTIAQVGLLPIIAIAAAVAVGIVAMVKLVQAGLSALSGGWSKMSGIAKAALIILAPLWLPVVGAIKLVQVGLTAIGKVASAVGNAFKSAFGAVASLVGDFVSGVSTAVGWLSEWLGGFGNFLSELAAGIPLVSQFVQALNAIGEMAAANAQSAAAEVRTFNLAVINGASQGGAAMVQTTLEINKMREAFAAAGQSAQFAEQMKAGLAQVDALLASNTLSAQEAQRAYMVWGLSISEATARAASAAKAAQASAQILVTSSQIMTGAMTRLGNAGKLTEQKLVSAFRKSGQAAMQLAQNSTIVAQRFQQSTEMNATEAQNLVTALQQEFGEKAPQIMAILAKSSSKSFAVIARGALQGRKGYEQYANAVGQSTGKTNQAAGSQTKLGAAMERGRKAAEGMARAGAASAKSSAASAKSSADFAKSAADHAKQAENAGRSSEDMARETKALEDAASGADKSVGQVAGSMGSAEGKARGATQAVSQLVTELNKLHDITITVTVNVVGAAALGGVVSRMALGGVVGLANGGRARTPLTMVGERGPELAALPPGTRVFSHSDTMGMLRETMGGAAPGGASGPQTIRGKLTLVNGEAYIEGVLLDTLADGRVVDQALSRRMRTP